MSSPDFVEEYYERIAADPVYRARLLADPVGVLCEEFGYTPSADLKIEIIEQAEDTIVIVVPPRPEAGEDVEAALAGVTERSLDLLFSSGIGGFFIPDDAQKWVLRAMRLASQKRADPDPAQT